VLSIDIQKTNKEITSALVKQELSLKKKLHSFYLRNIKNEGAPTESLRKIYGNQVKAVIREAVEKSYFTGVDLVKERVKEIDPRKIFFISAEDINNIQKITEDTNEQFWKTTGKLHMRESEFILTLDKELVKKKEFDTEAAYIGIAALIVFKGFNNSVVSKTRQVIDQNVK
jgi:hypothetical protein